MHYKQFTDSVRQGLFQCCQSEVGTNHLVQEAGRHLQALDDINFGDILLVDSPIGSRWTPQFMQQMITFSVSNNSHILTCNPTCRLPVSTGPESHCGQCLTKLEAPPCRSPLDGQVRLQGVTAQLIWFQAVYCSIPCIVKAFQTFHVYEDKLNFKKWEFNIFYASLPVGCFVNPRHLQIQDFCWLCVW